jgi:hypothetical protein
MFMKKDAFRGVILIEVAFCMLVNMVVLFGGLEYGWYFYSRQALVGAAREAVRSDFHTVAERTVQSYLIGMDFSDSFIDSVSVDFEQMTLTGSSPPTQVNKVSVSIPLTEVLLFGGEASNLFSTNEENVLTVTAYERVNNLKKKNNK